MGTARYLLALAGLALAVPLAGQTASGAGNFGDDSSRWANDGDCDDTRFVGDRGAGAWTSDDSHVGKDATDCRNLLNAGRIRWGEATDAAPLAGQDISPDTAVAFTLDCDSFNSPTLADYCRALAGQAFPEDTTVARVLASCDRINSPILASDLASYCRALVLPPSEGRRARFELFTECAAVFPIVFVQGDEAEEFGLTEERVRTMAESRLRAARLYGDGASRSDAALDVSIRTLDGGVAYTISIRLAKVSLYDPASGELGSLVTWERNAFGQHSRDASFIMQGLSEMLDAFILEYLRVNEGHCL